MHNRGTQVGDRTHQILLLEFLSGVLFQVWDEWSELTPDTVLTHFMFSIPLDAPPSFTTPALRLR